MDAAIRPTSRHRLAYALCAATAVHLGLLALPLHGPVPAIGVESLQIRLITGARSTDAPARPAAPAAPESRPRPVQAQQAAAPVVDVPPVPTAKSTDGPAPSATPPATAEAPAPAAEAGPDAAVVTAAETEVRLALARHFRYPLLARRHGWQGDVLLAVAVAADGSLGEPTVLRSSGHAVLDRAAVEALTRIPTLSWAPGTAFTLQLPVHYRLEKG